MKSATPARFWILPIIVFSQFAGTSLWFAGNAIIGNLQDAFQLSENITGHLTSVVQFGFIAGTLIFALFTISDRFSPSKVFFVCAILGAISNLSIYWFANGFISLLVLRFTTGFFLAGIYPVGMKISADWHEKGLGKALGYLVGALVIGTAFPHLLKAYTQDLSWKYVLFFTSGFAAVGGFLILFFVPDGPYRKKSKGLDLSAFFRVFQDRQFRSAAIGYFGHMWELYAFWAFTPLILETYVSQHPLADLDISLCSFWIIGIGGISCIVGGYLSQSLGSAKVAFISLLISGVCCLISPFLFQIPSSLFLILLLIWGMSVVSDSPQFSTLVAQTAPKTSTGTALTIVNCIGFAITIASIQLISVLQIKLDYRFLYLVLAIGPIIGLFSIYRGFLKSNRIQHHQLNNQSTTKPNNK